MRNWIVLAATAVAAACAAQSSGPAVSWLPSGQGRCFRDSADTVAGADTVPVVSDYGALQQVGHVFPRYPDAARTKHVVGRVLATFVVDTTGRVPLGTVRIERAPDPELARAVCEVFPRLRFAPLTVAGRPTAVRAVHYPFGFALSPDGL